VPERGAGDPAARGVLSTRPGAGPRPPAAAGTIAIGGERPRAALLQVPRTYDASRPAPLVLTLHGAGGTAEHGLGPLAGPAEDRGMLLLAPRSARATWDVIVGRYGPDVAAIDELLAQTFARYAVDPSRVASSGFSDGASYALSLGLANGDLFRSILAFSPGFVAPAEPRGTPRVFSSHGTRDAVLPIERCSRRIVPDLRRDATTSRTASSTAPAPCPRRGGRSGGVGARGDDGLLTPRTRRGPLARAPELRAAAQAFTAAKASARCRWYSASARRMASGSSVSIAARLRSASAAAAGQRITGASSWSNVQPHAA